LIKNFSHARLQCPVIAGLFDGSSIYEQPQIFTIDRTISKVPRRNPCVATLALTPLFLKRFTANKINLNLAHC
jgi:hypothetical protein